MEFEDLKKLPQKTTEKLLSAAVGLLGLGINDEILASARAYAKELGIAEEDALCDNAVDEATRRAEETVRDLLRSATDKGANETADE